VVTLLDISGGWRERSIEAALAMAAPWKGREAIRRAYPVVVTLEHGAPGGARPWWWGCWDTPVEESERKIIEAVLWQWDLDAPHPITWRAENCRLSHDEGIVYFLEAGA
jgi:hypothetical protein